MTTRGPIYTTLGSFDGAGIAERSLRVPTDTGEAMVFPHKIEVEERPDVEPVCPHCDEPLRTVWTRVLAARFGRRYIYFCSNCAKVLGVSHRKGFWMG